MKYPLLLKPVVKDYIWGGDRLIKEYGLDAPTDIAAEGWMLSCHKDGTNIVINGEYNGECLDSVLEKWGYTEKFPILIKLIDAKDKLSVQVHPDNAYALEKEGEFGKTEMWYVVDCKENSRLAYGFNKNISQAEFKERIENNTLDEVINYVPVKKGDVFFIAAGTLHAIGEGILIAEIQQNSNTTYRVSDYGRLGKDGKPRELHIDKAVDVTETTPPTIPYGEIGDGKQTAYGKECLLAECEYFETYKIELSGEKEINCQDKFASVLVLSGNLEVCYESGKIELAKADCVLIPPNCKANLVGTAEIIYTLA